MEIFHALSERRVIALRVVDDAFSTRGRLLGTDAVVLGLELDNIKSVGR